jgi:hypothetical protein
MADIFVTQLVREAGCGKFRAYWSARQPAHRHSEERAEIWRGG